jgi:hypothetical protein
MALRALIEDRKACETPEADALRLAVTASQRARIAAENCAIVSADCRDSISGFGPLVDPRSWPPPIESSLAGADAGARLHRARSR